MKSLSQLLNEASGNKISVVIGIGGLGLNNSKRVHIIRDIEVPTKVYKVISDNINILNTNPNDPSKGFNSASKMKMYDSIIEQIKKEYNGTIIAPNEKICIIFYEL